MTKIKKLSLHEAQKIAAGEVVERPANIVKELLENALDAGATTITLHIENGGKNLIRIIDNGCGMSKEDARLCIEQHATSKITSIDDLEHITSFGFRGEALASIAAVSKVQITTKEANAETGVTLEISNSVVQKETITSCNAGTEITIADLFYNIPVRQKFLKSRETELRAIVQLFYAISLAHPAVSFTLFHDERSLYFLPTAKDYQDRFNQLFEQQLTKNSFVIEHKQDRFGLQIHGIASTTDYTRYDRNQIYFFTNNRWVKNYKLSQAFIKGYQNILPTNKFPSGCLFLTIDPKALDINIHPKKEEVKFLNPRIVEDFITEAITGGLDNHRAIIKNHAGTGIFTQANTRNQAHSPQSQSFNTLSSPAATSDPGHTASNKDELLKKMARATEKNYDIERSLKNIHETDIHSKNNYKQSQQLTILPTTLIKETSEQKSLQDKAHFDNALNTAFPLTEVNVKAGVDLSKTATAFKTPNTDDQINSLINTLPFIPSTESITYKIIGQLKMTYILVETAEGMVIIDQHAAHERIVYERLRSTFESPARIRLLFPQVIKLTADDASLFEPYCDLLESVGIEAQRMSDTDIVITQTPVFLKNESLEECIKQAVGIIHEYDYLSEHELKTIMLERIHAQLSCKAAVKAGDTLSIETMHTIVKDLMQCPNKMTCPHGRPTSWKLEIPDIEKKFKRDYR